jgi:hypothetical protein
MDRIKQMKDIDEQWIRDDYTGKEGVPKDTDYTHLE